MPPLLLFAALLYAFNLLLGALAQTGRFHFGRAHHLLYFAVFAAAGLTTLLSFQPALLLTLVALAFMPRIRPGGWHHPLLALTGACGFVLAFTL